MTARWQFWIDRGGTFTDCVGVDPATKNLRVVKVASTAGATLAGIRKLLGLGTGAPIPPCDVRLGTTVATNALLERRGTPCALVTTRGFRDVLEIGTQARPRLFDIDVVKPSPLHSHVAEIDARCDPDGAVLARPSRSQIEAALAPLSAARVDSLAVVLLHAHANPELEGEVEAVARSLGFAHVSRSSEVAPEIGLLGRAGTTVLDAYLTPLLHRYVAELEAELPGSSVRFLQSSGGLARGARFRAPNAILSGPAGGLVAARHVARSVGARSAVAFDMGGTSTDVSRFTDELPTVYEVSAGGVLVRAPSLDIATVAAGGGSLCDFDGRKLTVGPGSAGADPGPLCYGNPASVGVTLTDVNLVLGRLVPDRFPFPLDAARARAGVEALAARVSAAAGPRTVEALAEDYLRVANDRMAEAIRGVSVARGHDPRGDALVVFGGAGGLHACAVAARLGVRRIVLHPLAGVLSAYGLGLAEVTAHAETDAGRRPLASASLDELAPAMAHLEAEVRRALADEGFAPADVRVESRLDLRHAGTEVPVTLPLAEAATLRARFDAAHEERFGYRRPDHAVEITVARITAAAGGRAPEIAPPVRTSGGSRRTATLFSGGRAHTVEVWDDDALRSGERVEGPAIVTSATSTTVVDPGFVLEALDDGVLLITHEETATAAATSGGEPDPATLAILGNAYRSIAEQMGEVLRRTATSTNIRERLDFSCALFDAEGGLVANAPHIPVHLGAMSESVRAVRAAHPTPQPGDVFVTNDPAAGGSHLPDITVVSPAHDDEGRLLFFTANRGHHADVGGISPGSMPPFSRSLAEEGVVFRALRVVHRGVLDRDGVLSVLRGGPWPARRPEENLADLEAQIAANRSGARLFFELGERVGLDLALRYMAHVQDDGAREASAALTTLPDGVHAFEDALDDGTPIRVVVTVRGQKAEIDFRGTGPELDSNLNAPHAVTVAAVLYVLRCLVDRDIPLNGGCLRPVTLLVPRGCVLAPSPERAVAGGNVETSQRVVDVLLGALGRAAASQGTMNNVTFGDDSFGYYETLAGGAGATPRGPGASAVHTHMTNTRITDPEVLEARYPVRVREHSVRRGSGGAGRHAGGDGLVRELVALAPLRASVLSERRARAPFGLAGGLAGAPGRNLVNGRDVGGKATFDLRPGDVLRVETPGGGGYGDSPGSRDHGAAPTGGGR